MSDRWRATPTEWLIHRQGPVALPYGPHDQDLIRVGIDSEGGGAYLCIKSTGGEVRVTLDELPTLIQTLRTAALTITASEEPPHD